MLDAKNKETKTDKSHIDCILAICSFYEGTHRILHSMSSFLSSDKFKTKKTDYSKIQKYKVVTLMNKNII